MSKVSTDPADSPKKVTRKRAVKAIVQNDEEAVTSSARARTTTVGQTVRKAPARTIVPTTVKPLASKRAIKILAVVVLMLLVSTWVGVSDSGQIDVNALITERNNKITSGEASSETNSTDAQSIVVPVQSAAPSVPNAGLHGRGVGTVNVPADTQVAASTSDQSIEGDSETVTGSTTESSEGGSTGSEIVQ